MPPGCLAPLMRAKAAFEELDGGEPIAADLREMAPGETVALPGGYTVTAVATAHRVPSQGYCLYSSAKAALPAEYCGLPGPAIRDALASGALVLPVTHTLELAVTGDTTMAGLLAQPLLLQAPVLVMELTFLDASVPVAKAQEKGHIHLDELAAHAAAFAGVRHLVLTHVSARHGALAIADSVAARLPPSLHPAVRLALAGFTAEPPALVWAAAAAWVATGPPAAAASWVPPGLSAAELEAVGARLCAAKQQETALLLTPAADDPTLVDVTEYCAATRTVAPGARRAQNLPVL